MGRLWRKALITEIKITISHVSALNGMIFTCWHKKTNIYVFKMLHTRLKQAINMPVLLFKTRYTYFL